MAVVSIAVIIGSIGERSRRLDQQLQADGIISPHADFLIIWRNLRQNGLVTYSCHITARPGLLASGPPAMIEKGAADMEGHTLLSALIALVCGFAALHLARVGFVVIAVFLTTAIVLVEAVVNDAGLWQTLTTWLLSACLFQVGYVLSMVFSAFVRSNTRLASMLSAVQESFWSSIRHYLSMKPKPLSRVKVVEKQTMKENDRET